MCNKQFAFILWTEEDQYSVVPTYDILGADEVTGGDEATIVWRVVKNRKIQTIKPRFLNILASFISYFFHKYSR